MTSSVCVVVFGNYFDADPVARSLEAIESFHHSLRTSPVSGSGSFVRSSGAFELLLRLRDCCNEFLAHSWSPRLVPYRPEPVRLIVVRHELTREHPGPALVMLRCGLPCLHATRDLVVRGLGGVMR